MKRQLALAVGVAAISWTTASYAQDTTVVQAPPPPPAQPTAIVAGPAPVTETSTGYSGPNRYMIGSGLVVFGLSYIPAVIVAGESSLPADHHLYIPIVGPWIDMGTRPPCGVNNVTCDNETTNKVLLGIDGVFQGLGALTTVFGFLMPEHNHVITTTAAADEPTIHFTPAQVGPSGYGAAAFGTF